MKFAIKHEIPGRIRLSAAGYRRFDAETADLFYYYLLSLPGVTSVKVYERSGNAAVCYCGDRAKLLIRISEFHPQKAKDAKLTPFHTSRALNLEYKNKLANLVLRRIAMRVFVPAPVRIAWTLYKAVGLIRLGINSLKRKKLDVAVLDATAVTVSLLRLDFKTASSVMFLLQLGGLIEEWTHKKSVVDLAGSMSLHTDIVWLCTENGERAVPLSSVRMDDLILVTVGNVIPLDGVVESGEAMVNQASMTGESAPVRKTENSTVYAGTVLEEGELRIRVSSVSGDTRYEKIIGMIEDSEKLKSSVEGKAASLADRLVPYSFLGTLLTLLITRNPKKALSVLMVDFSCALKLSMPVTVLSAMRECNQHRIVVKGGKYLEAVATADTIVFDKTGTLTKAQPSVREVVPFGGRDRDEMLRTAGCLEEHFPHSIANAVVRQCEIEGLDHEEMHANVQYIIAHGISSEIDGKEVCIGSYHFIFEDRGCEPLADDDEERFKALPSDCSLLYLSIGRELAAAICIEDPLREEAGDVIRRLKDTGISKVVMMTGDSERTACEIAKKVGVDSYYSEVLPEDKAAFVQKEKDAGRTVIMIGDGINDSPALSAADVGIAVSEGAQLAREIADIVISEDCLEDLITLRLISVALMKRIHQNYRLVIGINSALLAAGFIGLLSPATSSLFHNISTLGISLHGMTNLLDVPKKAKLESPEE